MPELPEVETTLRGIAPHLTGQIITRIEVRHPKLRWPIPTDLDQKLSNKRILKLYRRGKYLIIKVSSGALILHLGMSGKLRILTQAHAPKKHDHLDIYYTNGCLRFTDPRRFGAVLWTSENPELHPLLANIGPEPLKPEFSSQYLLRRAEGKKVCIKSFIMDSRVVAGVGNIYATEALFLAGIKPNRAAASLTLENHQHLSKAIKNVLKQAIAKGGTTLKDFANSDGSPGYFSIKLKAYGRQGKPCVYCQQDLKMIRIAQRSTVYCNHCQC